MPFYDYRCSRRVAVNSNCCAGSRMRIQGFRCARTAAQIKSSEYSLGSLPEHAAAEPRVFGERGNWRRSAAEK